MLVFCRLSHVNALIMHIKHNKILDGVILTPLKKIDNLIKNNQIFDIGSRSKTTNINILLNRVRQEKKNRSKKKIVLFSSIISTLFLISILAFGN